MQSPFTSNLAAHPRGVTSIRACKVVFSIAIAKECCLPTGFRISKGSSLRGWYSDLDFTTVTHSLSVRVRQRCGRRKSSYAWLHFCQTQGSRFMRAVTSQHSHLARYPLVPQQRLYFPEAMREPIRNHQGRSSQRWQCHSVPRDTAHCGR